MSSQDRKKPQNSLKSRKKPLQFWQKIHEMNTKLVQGSQKTLEFRSKIAEKRKETQEKIFKKHRAKKPQILSKKRKKNRNIFVKRTRKTQICQRIMKKNPVNFV